MAKELIVEVRSAPVRLLEEVDASGALIPNGTLRFEAIVSEADFLNRNRRVYPEHVLFPAFEQYNAQIADGTAQPGLVDHPERGGNPSLLASGVKWERFHFEGKLVIGTGTVIMTHAGKDLAAVMKAGVSVPFSTRGYGEQIEIEGPDGRPARQMLAGYELETVDAVADASVKHARLRRISQEDTDQMEKELEELKAALAEANTKLAAYESAATNHTSTVEGLNGTVAALTTENAALVAKVAELEAKLAEVQASAGENALTVHLHKLTEGHRFAATIIKESLEMGVTLASADKVVARVKILVEAAGAAANDTSKPRGDTSTSEDTDEVETDGEPQLTAEKLLDLRQGNLLSQAEYQVALALLG